MEFKVLCIGLEQDVLAAAQRAVAGATFATITSADDFFEKVLELNDQTQNLVLCGPLLKEIPILEIAQGVRGTCHHTHIIFASKSIDQAKIDHLTKNGFNQAFFFPNDESLFIQTIAEIEREACGNTRRIYKSVPAIDLGEISTDFDVFLFLPMNGKYVKLLQSGQAFTLEQQLRFKERMLTTVHIDSSDIGKYYAHATAQMKATFLSRNSVDLDAQEKLKGSVRSIFLTLLAPGEADFSKGQDLSAATKAITDSFIPERASGELKDIVLRLIGDKENAYSHAYRVATFAVLFSMALQKGNPEVLGIAAIFHDLAIATLPGELVGKSVNAMTDFELRDYQRHPLESIKLVQQRRMILSEDIQKAIEQHHERIDGKGYPKALPAHRLSADAQVLSLADQFDELTSTEAGKARLNPLEALEQILKDGAIEKSLVQGAIALFKAA